MIYWGGRVEEAELLHWDCWAMAETRNGCCRDSGCSSEYGMSELEVLT